jgi:hypothetical protein
MEAAAIFVCTQMQLHIAVTLKTMFYIIIFQIKHFPPPPLPERLLLHSLAQKLIKLFTFGESSQAVSQGKELKL